MLSRPGNGLLGTVYRMNFYERLIMSDLAEEIFGKEMLGDKPKYKGGTVYRDMADNLTKIKFPVIVTEGYTPNVHWSYMREGAPPPIYTPGPNMEHVPCHAMLSGQYIIDALVTGQELSFENPDDMDVLADWIEQFLKTYEGIDLTKLPDRKTFNANAKRALGMLRNHLQRKEDWESTVNPKPISILELIAHM